MTVSTRLNHIRTLLKGGNFNKANYYVDSLYEEYTRGLEMSHDEEDQMFLYIDEISRKRG